MATRRVQYIWYGSSAKSASPSAMLCERLEITYNTYFKYGTITHIFPSSFCSRRCNAWQQKKDFHSYRTVRCMLGGDILALLVSMALAFPPTLGRLASSSSIAALAPTELLLQCSDGVTIAGQVWKSPAAPTKEQQPQQRQQQQQQPPLERILCLHGWMDNCRSFHYLAPAIVQARPHVELVALDFPGHGLSSHKSKDGPPMMLSELAYYVAEAVRELDWMTDPTTKASGGAPKTTTFAILGHSMGAAVGCVYSAAFPEQVDRLILVEGAGPLARKTHDVAKHLRQHVQKRLSGNLNPREPRLYDSLELAVQTRCFTAKNFPGNQWLSTEAATQMVLRGTIPVGDNGGRKFRHDPRLQWPSLQYFTTDQVDAVLEEIQCPSALILADDGWPFDEERYKATVQKLNPLVVTRLPGSHHFHADPETAERVSQEVISFLNMYESEMVNANGIIR